MAIKINGVTVIDDSRIGNLAAATAAGNVVAGNVLTGGVVSASGNITGNYLFGNGSQLTGIDATSIQSGTSNVRVVSSGGNVAAGVGGTSNVMVLATTGAYVTGAISASGNITGNYLFGNGSTLSGIITSVSNINNGTTNMTAVSSGGNIAATIGGTSNVQVLATTGSYITGVNSASGNVTGANINSNFGMWSPGESATGHQALTLGLTSGAYDYGNSVLLITANNVLSAEMSIQNLNNAGRARVNLHNDQASNANVNYTTFGMAGSNWNNPVGGPHLAGDGYLLVVKDVNDTAPFGSNLVVGSWNACTKLVAKANVIANVSPSGVSVAGNVLASGVISATGNVVGGGITLSGNTIFSSGSTLTIDPSTTGLEGNVIIAGNLSVQGNVTYIDSTTITTNEKDITLANNVNTQASVNGAGLLLGNNSVVTLTYNSTSNAWVSNVGLSTTGTVTAISTVGGVITGSSASVTGTVTGASVVGGVMTGTSVSVTGTVTGTSVVGGVMTGSSVSVTGTVTGASVVGGVMTGTSVSVTGNVDAGNLRTGGLISSTGNITGGNVLTGIVSASGNVTGANYLTAGLVSATGNVTTGGNLNITGDIYDTGALTINTASNGNITLNPNGTGVIIANKDLLNGQANGVGNIGNATGYFNTIFAKATSAQYADLAEMYEADAIIEPGTVVCFGGAKEVTQCNEDGSKRVAGVVSTNPSYIMNAGLAGENVTAVALTGRVPTKVTGSIRKGDMLVAAGVGRARAESDPAVGTVIGKALADFDGADGVIEVVVGRL